MNSDQPPEGTDKASLPELETAMLADLPIEARPNNVRKPRAASNHRSNKTTPSEVSIQSDETASQIAEASSPDETPLKKAGRKLEKRQKQIAKLEKKLVRAKEKETKKAVKALNKKVKKAKKKAEKVERKINQGN